MARWRGEDREWPQERDGGGINSFILFRIFKQENVIMFKRLWEKFFQERVMILASPPAVAPIPAISSPSSVLSPSPPSSSPPSLLRTGREPTPTPAFRTGLHASPHRNGPFAQVAHHTFAAPTPALRLLCCPGLTARSKAIGPRSCARHFRPLTCARHGVGLGAEQPLHWPRRGGRPT